MSAALRVIAVPGSGAEDVLVVTSGPDAGAVVTGTDDGSIWRIHGDGRRIDRIASPRDPLVERLQHGPRWLRRRVTRIPGRVWLGSLEEPAVAVVDLEG